MSENKITVNGFSAEELKGAFAEGFSKSASLRYSDCLQSGILTVARLVASRPCIISTEPDPVKEKLAEALRQTQGLIADPTVFTAGGWLREKVNEALLAYTDEKASLAHAAFLEERERHEERPEPKADEEEFRYPGDAS